MSIETLNKRTDILNNRISETLEQNKEKVQKSMDQIEHELDNMHDQLITVGQSTGKTGFSANGELYLELSDNGHMQSLRISDHAITQIAQKFSIAPKFAKELRHGQNWHRELLAHTFNEYNKNNTRSRQLIRSVDGVVRGFLSSRYRRLNSKLIYFNFIEKVVKEGAIIIDANINPTRSWIDSIHPEVRLIDSNVNGQIPVAIGMRIGSSEYGAGTLEARLYLKQVMCMNGMVGDSVMKEVHLGKELPHNIEFSQRTYELDTKSQISALGDIIEQMYSEDAVNNSLQKIKEAASKEIDMERNLNSLFNQSVITKSEKEEVTTILANGREEDGCNGGPSMWKLTQGLTRLAQNKESTRQKELEELSGKLLNFGS